MKLDLSEKYRLVNNSWNYVVVISLVTTLLTLAIIPSVRNDIDKQSLFLYSIKVGLLSIAILIFFFFIIQRLLPKYFEQKNYTFGRHIVFLQLLAGSISLGLYILAKRNNLVHHDLGVFFYKVLPLYFLYIFLPFFTMIVLLFFVLKKIHLGKARELNTILKGNPSLESNLSFESLGLHSNRILHMKVRRRKSSTLWYLDDKERIGSMEVDNNSIVEKIMNSDSYVEIQPRVYINLANLVHVEGTAQGYVLFMNKMKHEIMVYFAFMENFEKKILECK